MHQKEDLVARARPAFADPNARRVLLSLLAMCGEADVVGAVVKVNQALKIEHVMAASLRYGATLARDYPEVFQQLLSDFDKKESEKIIMSEPQQVLTVDHLYTGGRRFLFPWGRWPCELVVPSGQTSYKNNCISHRLRMNARTGCNFHDDLTGFSARISFPLRRVSELQQQFIAMSRVGHVFVLDGVRIASFIEFDGPDERFSGRENHLHDFWLSIQKNGEGALLHLHADAEVGHITFGFRFGGHYMPDDKLELLYDDTFRTDLMLAHLRHYFGIPTAPINYYVPEPEVKEVKVLAQESQKGAGMYGTPLSLVSLAWDQLLSTAVMSGGKEIAFQSDCDGTKVYIRAKNHEARWNVPERCHLGDVYDLVKRKAGLDLDSEEESKRRRQRGKFNQCFFLRHIDCEVETYYDDCGHGESLVITLSYK